MRIDKYNCIGYTIDTRKTKDTNNHEEVGYERGLIPMKIDEPPVSQHLFDKEGNESKEQLS